MKKIFIIIGTLFVLMSAVFAQQTRTPLRAFGLSNFEKIEQTTFTQPQQDVEAKMKQYGLQHLETPKATKSPFCPDKPPTKECPLTITEFPWFEGFESWVYDDNEYCEIKLGEDFCFTTHTNANPNDFIEMWGTWGITHEFQQHTGKLAARHTARRNQTSWMVTPPIVMPNDGKVYVFDFWSINLPVTSFPANAAASNLEVWISKTTNDPTAGTNPFVKVKTLAGGEISQEYKKLSVSLADYAGETIYIALHYSTGADLGVHWYVDDFSISEFQRVDASVSAITAPGFGEQYYTPGEFHYNLNLTTEESVTAVIKNNGSSSITGFQLALYHGNTLIATETFNGTIASLQQASHTFATKLDLSAGDGVSGVFHTIRVAVTLTGDADQSNDTLSKTIRNVHCPVQSTFPYITPFSPGIPLCWTAAKAEGSESDGWRWFATGGGTGAAASQSVLDFGWMGQIELKPDDYLISPQIYVNTANLAFSFEVLANHMQFFQENFSVMVSRNSRVLADFEEIYTERISEPGFINGAPNWKKIRLALDQYIGDTIYIAFRHWNSTNESAILFTNAVVEKFENFIDGQMVSILSPTTGENLTANENVTVRLRNNGSAAISGFTLKLELNGVEVASEVFSGSIPKLSQVDHTFNHKLDLSKFESNNIRVTIEGITGDQVPNNNSKSKIVAHFNSQPVKLFGYDNVLHPEGLYPNEFVSILSNDPGTFFDEHAYSPEAPAVALSAGEYFDGYFYGYTVSVRSSDDALIGEQFVKISTETWTVVSSSPTNQHAIDMAYDYSTGTMFGLRTINVQQGQSLIPSKQLVTINMETGAMTPVGQILGNVGNNFLALACSKDGQLFTIDGLGNLVRINKTNAALSMVGSTWIFPEPYLQSMAFDHNTGRLFWSSVNSRLHCRLIELDPVGAAAIDRGRFMWNAQLVGLHTPYDHTTEPNFVKPIVEHIRLMVYPNPVTDVLTIETEETIKQVFVLDINGRTVMQVNGDNKTINLQSLPTGSYIIRIHTETRVVPVRIVKQ
jgi:hypothetical protein